MLIFSTPCILVLLPPSFMQIQKSSTTRLFYLHRRWRSGPSCQSGEANTKKTNSSQNHFFHLEISQFVFVLKWCNLWHQVKLLEDLFLCYFFAECFIFPGIRILKNLKTFMIICVLLWRPWKKGVLILRNRSGSQDVLRWGGG